MALVKLGKDCEFVLNNTVSTNVTDVTVDLNCDSVDVTTRGGNGWKQEQATLNSCTITTTIYEKENDYTYTTLKAAFFGTGSARIVTITAGGVTGRFMITKFSRSEPLTEGVKIDVEFHLVELISVN